MSLNEDNVGNLYIGLLAWASFLAPEPPRIHLSVRCTPLGLWISCNILGKFALISRIFGYDPFESDDSRVYQNVNRESF